MVSPKPSPRPNKPSKTLPTTSPQRLSEINNKSSKVSGGVAADKEKSRDTTQSYSAAHSKTARSAKRTLTSS